MSELLNAAAFAYPAFPTKAARLQWFRSQLATPEWGVWGLVTVFTYQTEAEQQVETTDEDNGVGFTGTDGTFLTSLAKQWNAKNYLSAKQVAILAKRMPKYAAQLIGHLEKTGVTFVIDKKAAAPVVSTPVAADDVPTVPPSPLFGEAPAAPAMSIGTAPAAKPGEPDWKVYRAVLGLSAKADKRDEFVAAVAVHLPKFSGFALDVWNTVKGYPAGKIPSFRQGKVLAVACARIAAGLPCDNKQAAA